MTKWMEAQGDEWNGWDHLYPVSAEVTQEDRLVRLRVPLSSSAFLIALRECRSKVSTLMEAKRLERAQEVANHRKNREYQGKPWKRPLLFPARRPNKVCSDECKAQCNRR